MNSCTQKENGKIKSMETERDDSISDKTKFPLAVIRGSDTLEIYKNEEEKLTFCYDDYKKIKKIYSSLKNIKNDFEINFYSNGNIEGIRHFQNDSLNGSVFLFMNNGNLSRIVDFKNGNLDGRYYLYNSKGEIVEKYTYKDGKMLTINK